MASPRKWLSILGVMVIIGVLGIYGISIWGHHSVSGMYIIPAGIFSPHPQQSGIIPPTFSAGEAAPVTCNPPDRREYQVTGGKPFIFRGSVHDNTTQSVEIVTTTLMNLESSISHLPVDPSGQFLFRITGNETEQIRNDYTSGYSWTGESSPFVHICIGYPAGTECFDLRVTGEVTDLPSDTQKDWIRIDPIPDPTISVLDREGYTGNFFINGTTSLPPGEQVRLVVGSLCFLPCPKYAVNNTIGCCGDKSYKNEATVQKGPCGVNTWSFLVNTTPDRFVVASLNGKYDINHFRVVVSHANRTMDDNGWDAGMFTIRVR